MIQDIAPHRLYNTWQPDKHAQPEDFVICVQDGRLLGGRKVRAALQIYSGKDRMGQGAGRSAAAGARVREAQRART